MKFETPVLRKIHEGRGESVDDSLREWICAAVLKGAFERLPNRFIVQFSSRNEAEAVRVEAKSCKWDFSWWRGRISEGGISGEWLYLHNALESEVRKQYGERKRVVTMYMTLWEVTG